MKNILVLIFTILALPLLAQNKGLKYPALATELDSIMVNDQSCRGELQQMVVSGKIDTAKLILLSLKMKVQDSIDLLQVEAILAKYGWLDTNEVGVTGNQTLFIVIQHSSLKVQEKYLPMMQKAATQNKVRPSELAMLEDRVNIGEGKKQVYGSQLASDEKTGNLIVSPIDDPDNLDKRRAKVGMPPMAQYCSYFNLKWDLEKYKKGIPLDKLDPGQNPMNGK